MRVVQIGANKGNDDLAKHLKKNYKNLEFGLFIEPNSLHIDDLKKCYEGYKNVFIENIAVKVPSYNKDKLRLYYHTNDGPCYGITSHDIQHIQKHVSCVPHLRGGEIKSFEVPCISLDDLFEKYEIKELDWLLIDAEGIESELLLNTDWKKYNIKKIEFEHLHLDESKEQIRTLFKELGYVQTYSLHSFDEAWIKKEEVTKMDITLYAIARNEEKNIERFLENSKKFSHTIVVDTGSTDNTIQLLRDAGVEVYEHPQTREEFDFALARNTALSYVKTDWAFSLDFNEDVSEMFVDGLEFVANDVTCLKHHRYDDNGKGEPKESGEVHVRFHRTKNYEWKNAVHEVPNFVPTEEFPVESVVQTNIKITKKVNKSVDKELFYLSICEREYQKDPTNWYYIWFIFNHYYSVKNFEKTLHFGQEFLNNSKPYFDTFRVECFIKCSQVLFQTGNLQLGSNYAFHALSEAMNMGQQYIGMAFTHLLQVGININNPDIVVFASAFSEETRHLPQRKDAIQHLFEQK